MDKYFFPKINVFNPIGNLSRNDTLYNEKIEQFDYWNPIITNIFNTFSSHQLQHLDTAYKTTTNLSEAFNDISQLTGFAAIATNDQLEAQIVLTKQLGQSKEEALGLQETFAVNNIEADKGIDIVYDQIAAFANQNKIVADGRKILTEVSKTSKLIQLNFKGNTPELVKTVLDNILTQSNLLGTEITAADLWVRISYS